jgi:hypothetical protein
MKSSVGYKQLRAANKSQVKGEMKAINNETAKTGRIYHTCSIFYKLEPENDIQSGDFECKTIDFLNS